MNRPQLQDYDLPRIFEFMKEFPALEGKFNDLKKVQARYCIEKMKIKMYNRGTRLFKKGEPHIYAYIVLLGVVNIYDECQHDHSHDEEHSHDHDSHVGELIFNVDSHQSKKNDGSKKHTPSDA